MKLTLQIFAEESLIYIASRCKGLLPFPHDAGEKIFADDLSHGWADS